MVAVMKKILTSLFALAITFTLAAQSPWDRTLDSALVTAHQKERLPGLKRIYSPEQAALTISVFGEPDLIRHISSLPGVSQGMEGTMGLFVRGSASGSNRIMFDGIPLYSYSHLLGMMSAISTDIIRQVDFQTGGASAQYGNFSSALINLIPKSSLQEQPETRIALSPYLSSAFVSRKLSDSFGLQGTVRTSLIPIIGHFALPLFTKEYSTGGVLYDACIKADWLPSSRHHLDFTAYSSADAFRFSNKFTGLEKTWYEHAAKAGWDFQANELLSIRSRAYFLSFVSRQTFHHSHELDEDYSRLNIQNTRQEATAESTAEWKILKGLSADAGFSYTFRRFLPSNAKIIDVKSERTETSRNEEFGSHLLSLFADLEFQNERLTARAGLRPTLCTDSTSRAMLDCDIKALVQLHLSRTLTATVSADRMVQYHHTLEGLPIGWSLDSQIPASEAFPQERTHQLYAGLAYEEQFGQSKLRASAGSYLRKMEGMVSYRQATNVFITSDVSWEQAAESGQGHSRGIELSAEWSGPRHELNLSYTLSKTDRLYPGINGGNPFPFKFDRPHIINLESLYRVTARQYATLSLAYSSGNLATLPVSVYEGVLPPHWAKRIDAYGFPQEVIQNIYSRQELDAKNSFRLPDYFRIDISYTFCFHHKRSDSELTLSVYNVTNRHNPYAIYNEGWEWKQVSILPILPSVRWAIRF